MNCKIYKLTNDINNLIYIGSTQNKYLSKRKAQHKYIFTKPDINCSSKKIFEGNGNVKIELLELFTFNDIDEIKKKERDYIKKINCVNIQIPERDYKEWRLDNVSTETEFLTCECGKSIQKRSMTRHKKGKQHLKKLNN